MKKILLSSVALLGLTAAAVAADLPSRRAAPAPYVAVPVFTWTGFYVGVNAGYGFSNNDRNGLGVYDVVAGGTTPQLPVGTRLTNGDTTGSNDGFVGGGQIGYNYQIGQFVIGIEADAQFADLNNSRPGSVVAATTPAGAPLAGFVGAQNANFGGIDWFGTVRGRLGYAMDRFMIYGTGGFAFGGADQKGFTDGYGTYRGTNNDTRTGYAAGGGIEYAFTPNFTGKIEGLYVNLERNRNNGFVGTYGGTPVYTTGFGRSNNDSDFAVIRAGLNYKFTSY